MQLIETIKDSCHECYACVRNCPVWAIQVKNGQAEVIEEKCINCAHCLDICSQKAKKVYNFKEEVKKTLESDKKIIVGLAPSFPAFDSEITFKDWKIILKKLGIDKVYEVAWGAEIIFQEYKEYIKNSNKTVLSSACPVVVNFIEKYYPELVENLAPIVSPMKALIRYINEVENDEYEILMIGPCQAKKEELIEEKNVKGILTYSELFEVIEEIEKDQEKNISSNINNINEKKKVHKKNLQPSNYAREIPLAGGLLKAIKEDSDFSGEVIRVEGEEKIRELFESILANDIEPDFVDLLFCEGCISGVDLVNINYFKKENSIKQFLENIDKDEYLTSAFEQVTYNKEVCNELNFEERFSENHLELPAASESDIWKILNKTNKYEESDLLNCGACGYKTCKNKALAVYQGLAEVEMCLPFLISEKREEIKEVQKLNLELDKIIDSSYDGMLLVNEEGEIIRVNNAYLKMVNSNRKNILGKNVIDLEKEKLVYPSVALLCLNEKREISLIQNTSCKKKILATASPILEKDNSLSKVIVNARDIEEFYKVMESNQENNKLKAYLKKDSKDEIKTKSGYIIKKSVAMKKIINMADKVAKSNSTVLITGESGTGKEVVARYIYDKSINRNKFVKINCAAIPETLLESELFGYETGAFSGAKRAGKAGKIELADKGVLFLDEIGEIPLNMQAKLLQVIQEHKVNRIGGVESIDVDFRLIAATNRDLEKMVKEDKFREDLFYRLNVVPIEIPPLRERKKDIKPLVDLIKNKMNMKYNKEIIFTQDAYEFLIQMRWPGNIRELNNLIERIIVTSNQKIINKNKLKEFVKKNENKEAITINELMPLKEAVKEVEKQLLEMVRKENNSTYDMADKLKINQSTVVRKLNKYFNN